MVKALSQAEIDRLAAQGAEELRRSRAPAPPPINVDEVIRLSEPLYLEIDGVRYGCRQLGMRDGIQLDRARLIFKQASENPPATVEALEELEAELIETMELLYSLLEPRPERDPFGPETTATEVGQLLGFFYWHQMRQAAERRSRVGTAAGLRGL